MEIPHRQYLIERIKKIVGPSWITSLGGLAVLTGYVVKVVVDPKIGDALIVGGTSIALWNARDKNAPREEHGS